MENQLSKIGIVKGKKKESMEEAPGSCKFIFINLFFIFQFYEFLPDNTLKLFFSFTLDFSRKNSLETGEASRDSEYVILKERRLVPRGSVFDGMLRFSFLLDTCQPGSVPDHHLMAALLDLVRINLLNKNI